MFRKIAQILIILWVSVWLLAITGHFEVDHEPATYEYETEPRIIIEYHNF